MEGRLCLVGAGRMGAALLAGWIARGVAPQRLRVVEPDPKAAKATRTRFSVAVADEPEGFAWPEPPRAVIFAVKPQSLDEVAPRYRAFGPEGTVFLSIAAGRTIASLERHLGAESAVVRAMPNTPAAIGRGMTVACANARVDESQRALCRSLLQAVGEVEWVDEEALLDPVTAVSGSGPAYVFLFIECLAEAGAAAGLPAELSMRLARRTVSGSGELALASKAPVDRLRRDVTSPGGTTEAALSVLMGKEGLQSLLTRAVAAATRRSRELAR